MLQKIVFWTILFIVCLLTLVSGCSYPSLRPGEIKQIIPERPGEFGVYPSRSGAYVKLRLFPNSEKVAVFDEFMSYATLWEMDLQGRHMKKYFTTTSKMERPYVWSLPIPNPNHKQIAFSMRGGKGDGARIFVFSMIDNSLQMLEDLGGIRKEDLSPSEKEAIGEGIQEYPIGWTENGKKIIFRREDFKGKRGYTEIWEMDSDGKNREKLTEIKDLIAVDLSLDGRHLLVCQKAGIDNVNQSGAIYTLWQMDLITGKKSEIIGKKDPLGVPVHPRWSPDMKKIALTGGGGIWLLYLNNENKEPEFITDGIFCDWTADSKKIIYTRNIRYFTSILGECRQVDGSNVDQIFIMDIE